MASAGELESISITATVVFLPSCSRNEMLFIRGMREVLSICSLSGFFTPRIAVT